MTPQKSTFISNVIINRRVYEDIVIFSSRYASEYINPEDQREVYGILVGKVDTEKAAVYVNQAIGIVVGKRTGVEFESKEYVDLSNIDETVWKRSVEYNRGDFICGWWHTHPGFGFFYSQTDILNHIGFQTTNPYAIGIIYDYTQQKYELDDPGIEVLTLEEPNVASPFVFVNYQIQDKRHALDHLKRNLESKFKELKAVESRITFIQKELESKQFAQVQRNYGLLLLHKSNKKKSKKELEKMKDEERWLYEWNEETIKKSYEIPNFRKKIEKLIEISKKDKGKRGKTQIEIETLLNKPKDKVGLIYNQYKTNLEEIRNYRRWLGAEERLILSHFNDRIIQYIKILNALISKSYYLMPHLEKLEDELFDESILDKVYYGQEEEIEGLENKIKENLAINNEIITPIINFKTKFNSVPQDITSSFPQIEPKKDLNANQKIMDDQVVNAIVDSMNNQVPVSIPAPTKIDLNSSFIPSDSSEKEQKSQNQEKILSFGDLSLEKPNIPSPELNNIVQKKKKSKQKLDDAELVIKDGKLIEENEIELFDQNPEEIEEETLSEDEIINSTKNGNLVKIKSNQPVQITFDLKPVKIENTQQAFQIDIDELFEEENNNETKKCPFCLNNVPKSAHFCNKCGRTIV